MPPQETTSQPTTRKRAPRKPKLVYRVRRPMTLFGTAYAMGDVVPMEVWDKILRSESLIRSGKVNEEKA